MILPQRRANHYLMVGPYTVNNLIRIRSIDVESIEKFPKKQQTFLES